MTRKFVDIMTLFSWTEEKIEILQTTSYMRTYRFIQFDIETDDESLIIDDYYGMFWPTFEQVNHFECDDENLMKIADVKLGEPYKTHPQTAT